jgi:NAD-dependent deacetylase
MEVYDSGLEESVRLLHEARSLVVSTGAGISKESGIPTFRDAPNALWAAYDPETLASPEGFRTDPALVWRWYNDRRAMIAKAKPNPGHLAIADLEKSFDDFTLITQNIDDLHRRAGSQNIIEVHGNVFRYRCFDRNHPIESLPQDDRVPPKCRCGSLIRPDVVWFGELFPEGCLERCSEVLTACEVLLVVGTSGTVYPAAGFPSLARGAGARVIEINPEVSAITPHTDIFLRGPAGEVLPDLVARLKGTAR